MISCLSVKQHQFQKTRWLPGELLNRFLWGLFLTSEEWKWSSALLREAHAVPYLRGLCEPWCASRRRRDRYGSSVYHWPPSISADQSFLSWLISKMIFNKMSEVSFDNERFSCRFTSTLHFLNELFGGPYLVYWTLLSYAKALIIGTSW